MRTIKVKREEFERALESAKMKPDVRVRIVNSKKFIETIGEYAFAVEMEEEFEQITIYELLEG